MGETSFFGRLMRRKPMYVIVAQEAQSDVTAELGSYFYSFCSFQTGYIYIYILFLLAPGNQASSIGFNYSYL